MIPRRIVVVAVFLFAGSFGGMCALDAWQCRSKWADSGFACRWGFLAGCQLEIKPGRWIPASAYRDVER